MVRECGNTYGRTRDDTSMIARNGNGSNDMKCKPTLSENTDDNNNSHVILKSSSTVCWSHSPSTGPTDSLACHKPDHMIKYHCIQLLPIHIYTY